MNKFLPTLPKIARQINELTKFKLSVLNGLVTVASYSLYSA